MDIIVARTFLEIVKTGSFVRAAANLNITQTAVSARIRVLEEQLDRQLFIRNKAGARLTQAGDQFLRYATSLVQLWERATSELGDLDSDFERGEFGTLREWLREHVHRWGRAFEPAELLQRVVGGPLDAEPYLAYLRAKVEALEPR